MFSFAVTLRTALAALVCVLVLSHGSRAFAQPPAESGPGNYVVGPQDVLSITVWDQPDLSGKFTVESDGSFTFPLIGRVIAGGMTLRALEGQLRQKLSDGYFKNPQVSVAVEFYRSQRVFVIGEVRLPGAYPLTGDMTLIEALARAGSTTAEAGGEAVVVRAPVGKTTTAPLLPNQEDASEVIRVNITECREASSRRTSPSGTGTRSLFLAPRPSTCSARSGVRAPIP